jgi:predicted component of type VI protein secretion system
MRATIATLPILQQVVHALLPHHAADLRITTRPDGGWVVEVPAPADRTLRMVLHEATNPTLTALCAQLRARAKTVFEREGELEFDEDAPVSLAKENYGRGAYIQAWCWVDKLGEHVCTACRGQWFTFELIPLPTVLAVQTSEEQQSGRCPACGEPCTATEPISASATR